MKHISILAVVLPLLFSLSSCKYDDAEIWNAIEDHEARISSLEETCKKINNNIVAIQYLLEALEDRDYITSVRPYTINGKEIGYSISFFKGESIIIYHGEDGNDGTDGTDGIDGVDGIDGADGSTPVISVAKDSDSIYYWTINGEWLLGESGEKIKAVGSNGTDGEDGEDGITPVIGIKKDYDDNYYWTINGEWLLDGDGNKVNLPDNGEENSSCYFSSITENEEGFVVFTLADGTEFKVPSYNLMSSFNIIFEDTDIVAGNGVRIQLPFTLTGAIGEIEIDAVALSSRNNESARIEMHDNSNGVLHIENIYDNFKVLVIASNNGRTAHKIINITQGEIYFYDYYEASAMGEEIAIPVSTNYNYDVVIPEEYANWISLSEIRTRAELRNEEIILSVTANPTAYEREVYIELKDKLSNTKLARIYIYQRPGAITLSADKKIIQADGNEIICLTVKSGWSTITENVEFFNEDNEKLDVEN